MVWRITAPVTLASSGQRTGVSMPRMHQKSCLDVSRPVRIATWNTLTFNKTGYPEATAQVFSRMGIKLAGLTETDWWVMVSCCYRTSASYTQAATSMSEVLPYTSSQIHKTVSHCRLGMLFQTGFLLPAFITTWTTYCRRRICSSRSLNKWRQSQLVV